jgi:hypothetical protein
MKPAEPEKMDWRAIMLAASANLPETVEMPYEATPEGQRLARFRQVCPGEFMSRIDRSQLKNPAAFDAVAKWDGSFPGPIAQGGTGTAKTRAAWSAIGRLFVKENRSFAWFTADRLMDELERYKANHVADEFWRYYGPHNFQVILVDDIDKINWQFGTETKLLFTFYDWVYRTRRPCITTTNQPRRWWIEKMGEPHVRRMFDDAHREIKV